jgi:dipeptidyl-peptidase-4
VEDEDEEESGMHAVVAEESLEEAGPGAGSKKAKRGSFYLAAASSAVFNMPSTTCQAHGDECTHFRIEDIVQYPLPGYVAPASVAFSPDDKLVSYLYSPDNTLSRKVFAFDPVTCVRHLLVNPPGGGVDEGNLSTAEKLRRERLRERGLGVTRYEWAKGGVGARLMVPLPGGIYVQDGAELRLRLASSPRSPILDPQLSPDGCSIAYVRDDELFILPISNGEPKQITFGARETGKVRCSPIWGWNITTHF